MARIVVLITCLVGPICAAGDDKDKDPVKEKLFQAKKEYDAEVEQYRKQAVAWFDKLARRARKDGNKKLVDQIKAERQYIEETGELSKTAPATLRLKPAVARKALEGAYQQAVKEYVKANKDAEADAVEKEFQNFLQGIKTAQMKLLLGTWKVSSAEYKGEWTFKDDGAVESSTSEPGKWLLDTTKGHVRITWKNGLQDKFDLPLKPNGTSGSQIGRTGMKLEAVKISTKSP